MSGLPQGQSYVFTSKPGSQRSGLKKLNSHIEKKSRKSSGEFCCSLAINEFTSTSAFGKSDHDVWVLEKKSSGS
jgi:hypothetical protein